MVKDVYVVFQFIVDGDWFVVYVVVVCSEVVVLVVEVIVLLLLVGFCLDIWVSVLIILLCVDGWVDFVVLKMCFVLVDMDIVWVEQVLFEVIVGVDMVVVLVDIEVQVCCYYLVDVILGWCCQVVEQVWVEDVVDVIVQVVIVLQVDVLFEGNILLLDLLIDLGVVLWCVVVGDWGVICIDCDGVVVCCSYVQVLVEVEKVLGGLSQVGVVFGDIVVFQLVDNLDVVLVFWVCVFGGLVLVLLGVLFSYDVFSVGCDKLFNICWLLQFRVVVVSVVQYSGIVVLLCCEDVFVVVFDGVVFVCVQVLGYLYMFDVDDVVLLLLMFGSIGMFKVV